MVLFALFDKYDSNNSGDIGFDDFVALYAKTKLRAGQKDHGDGYGEDESNETGEIGWDGATGLPACWHAFTSMIFFGGRSKQKAKVRSEMAVDWLCGNEVALYHHAFMLHSVVERSPESTYRSTTTSLTTMLLEVCEEELMLFIAHPRFLYPLNNSPDISTTRLNEQTRSLLLDTIKLLERHRGNIWKKQDTPKTRPGLEGFG
jgi:hypothetical protein